MSFDFEAFKKKYINQSESKIIVGNAEEIKYFIAAYEETQTALEEMSKELKKANERIKELETSLSTIANSKSESDASFTDMISHKPRGRGYLHHEEMISIAKQALDKKAPYMDLDD